MLVTNIIFVAVDRRQRTTERLALSALDLFEEHGYEETSVADIAAAAGVTQMTFFRHFPTKDRVLLDDPYDPALARAVAERPVDEPPLLRTARGLRTAWQAIPTADVALVRRRTKIIARTPSLRAATAASNHATEDAVTDQLVADGSDPLTARVAVAAVLSALTAALLWWAAHDDADLPAAIETALAVLDAGQS
jgi:AcrR family transcriptional regulator